jgi:hypothetical protein
METKFLKKSARVHKYRGLLSSKEIDTIVARHVPRLHSIQIFNFGSKTDRRWPEVTDEYHEQRDGVVANLRAELQKEFIKKIRLPRGSDSHNALNHYLQSI